VDGALHLPAGAVGSGWERLLFWRICRVRRVLFWVLYRQAVVFVASSRAARCTGVSFAPTTGMPVLPVDDTTDFWTASMTCAISAVAGDHLSS